MVSFNFLKVGGARDLTDERTCDLTDKTRDLTDDMHVI